MSHLIPFHVPIILSVHMLLGLHSRPVGWLVPVTLYGFSCAKILTHPYQLPFYRARHISMPSTYRPVHSWIRQFISKHSVHEHFIDSQPIRDDIHLWIFFVWQVVILQILRPLSAVFTELRTNLFSQKCTSEY